MPDAHNQRYKVVGEAVIQIDKGYHAHIGNVSIASRPFPRLHAVCQLVRGHCLAIDCVFLAAWETFVPAKSG